MGRYQYKRQPLSADDANRLANACETRVERLVIWTFLDTGMRVSERKGVPEHFALAARRRLTRIKFLLPPDEDRLGAPFVGRLAAAAASIARRRCGRAGPRAPSRRRRP